MKNFILKLPSFYNLVTALLLSKQMTEITLFNFLFCLIHLKKEVKESQLNVPFWLQCDLRYFSAVTAGLLSSATTGPSAQRKSA